MYKVPSLAKGPYFAVTMIFVGTPSLQLRAFLLAFAIISTTSIVSATTFNVVSRPRRDYVSPFAKRTDMSTYASHDDGTFVSNSGDLSYYSNVTIGGVTVEVMIDTGRFVCFTSPCERYANLLSTCSADLWTMTPVHESRNLSLPLEIRYAKGSAKGERELQMNPFATVLITCCSSGHISTATVEFDDYVISDQAYSASHPVNALVCPHTPSLFSPSLRRRRLQPRRKWDRHPRPRPLLRFINPSKNELHDGEHPPRPNFPRKHDYAQLPHRAPVAYRR